MGAQAGGAAKKGAGKTREKPCGQLISSAGIANAEEGGMPTISNDDVEAEARAILQDQIARSPWFREGMTEERERRERIRLEVDAYRDGEGRALADVV